MEAIRSATRTGRPVGDHNFMDKIERLTGRSLSKRKPGRRKADKLSVMSPEYAHFYSPIMPIWGSKMTILGLKTAILGTLI
ncbi:MAG: hypothetical protein COY50_00385 [Deltaproteobacteria bacterium CG_4_10_14_0_8_um_filter_43_12]|nr:MAG: hypothetical protein COY50_00385 [Deltaproteobacteria bacterium CG_4_10_14_0_8_um_filter_43_12]